jgi:lysophospholipase L1-like esterase
MSSQTQRAAAGAAALLLLPAAVLLDTGAALLRGWAPRASLYLAVSAACAAWFLGVGLLAALPAGRRWLARHWARSALVTFSLCAGWATVEAAARAVPGLTGQRIEHSRGPGVRRVFRPDPQVIAGIYGPSLYTTNALGMRAAGLPRPGVTYNILCVGGSTTECTYLDDSETWPHLLMVDLRAGRPALDAWVGGLGISGYSTVEHLEFLRRSPQLATADCVIVLAGINDFLKFLNGSIELGPRPLWRRSALAAAAVAFHRRRVLRRMLYEIEDEDGHNVALRRQARAQAQVRNDLPPLNGALAEYAERIGEIAATCRRRGVRCVFLTQPVLWGDRLGERALRSLWLGEDERGRFFTPGLLRKGMDRYNATLLTACSRLGTECVSLGSMQGNETYFLDDCHFTEAGAREVARIVAAHLRSQPGSARTARR